MSEFTARIAAVQAETKAIRMVTDVRRWFVLTNEDGSLVEPLTAGHKAKRYYKYD